MELSYSALASIAGAVSMRCDPDDRQDVVQNCWVWFLKWRPRSRSAAWKMARSAMAAWFKGESRARRREERAMRLGPEHLPSVSAQVEARIELQRLVAARPNAVRYLLSRRPPYSPDERRRASYQRAELRAVLESGSATPERREYRRRMKDECIAKIRALASKHNLGLLPRPRQ